MEKFYETYTRDFDLYAPRIGGNWLGADGQWVMDKPNKALSDCELSRYALSHAMTGISKMRPRNFTLKGMQGLGKTLKRLARNLWDKQMRNLGLIAQPDLQLDPAHRARVLEDLGGWKAMQSWRARYDKSFEYTPPKAAPQSRAARSARKGDEVKTDRDGLFRLPIIKTQFESAPRQSRGEYSRGGTYQPALAVFKPIQVHPNDLEYAPDVTTLRKGLRTAEAPMPLHFWHIAITDEYLLYMNEIDALIQTRLSNLKDFEAQRIDPPP